MQALYTDQHRAHAPKVWLYKGAIAQAAEVPQRAEGLLQAALEAGHDVAVINSDPAAGEFGPLHAVHDSKYLRFLQQAWSRWSQLPDSAAQMIPNVNLGRHIQHCPDSIVALAGHYQADGACPIGQGTWSGAAASAQVAISAANELMSAQHRQVYALCRPPGHHAYADMAG